MAHVLQTNHIPIIEPGDFAAEAFSQLILFVQVSPPTNSHGLLLGCQISWFCSGLFWDNVRALMVAAMLCQDDFLLEWLQRIAEVRYDTELCEEYSFCPSR